MKIKLEIYEAGGISCLSDECTYKKECANHRTAGYFRHEDGFRPEIHQEKGEYFCATADRPANSNSTYGNFPENYENLPIGAINIKKVQEASCINYQI